VSWCLGGLCKRVGAGVKTNFSVSPPFPKFTSWPTSNAHASFAKRKIDNHSNKTGPGREVDPPTGTGRIKPLADCWQITTVKTHEFLNAIDMPNPIPALLLAIQSFSLPADIFH
jgi:hypothetical protein